MSSLITSRLPIVSLCCKFNNTFRNFNHETWHCMYGNVSLSTLHLHKSYFTATVNVLWCLKTKAVNTTFMKTNQSYEGYGCATIGPANGCTENWKSSSQTSLQHWDAYLGIYSQFIHKPDFHAACDLSKQQKICGSMVVGSSFHFSRYVCTTTSARTQGFAYLFCTTIGIVTSTAGAPSSA